MFIKKYVIPVLACIGLFWLVISRHQYNPEFTWRSDLWADPAGYYVYLPALFIYDFDTEKLPAKIDSLCGEGFSIDEVNKKIFTKYSCGVAILQAPFFLIVHALENSTDATYKGFSGMYQMVPSYAAIFYSLLGLFFMFRFLNYYFSSRISALVTGSMFFGTNLCYYTVYGNGASHIFSFFLFAALLLLTKIITDENREKKTGYFILWSSVVAFILLIRPLNLLFIIPAAFIDCHSANSCWLRLKFFFNIRFILILVAMTLIVFFPQLLYWKYLSGNWIYYSYQNETFSNWKSPLIAKLLLSPNNGLLPYNPLYFLIILTLIFMLITRVKNGFSILLTFCALVYASASWHTFSYGCGYGCRNFAEYTVLFSFPLGWLFEQIKNSALGKYFMVILIVFCILINQKAIYSYDRCFFGNDWDYHEYSQELLRGSFNKKVYLKENGFINTTTEFSERLIISHYNTFSSFRKARVNASVELFNDTTDAAIVLEIKDKKDSTVNWNSVKISDYVKKINSLERVTIDFPLPKELDLDVKFITYVWNMNKDSLIVKDIEIDLK
jgi:hypothetical protein